MSSRLPLATVIIVGLLCAACPAFATGKPVRLFILAGQSNMLGSGNVNHAPADWRPLQDVLFDETVPDVPKSFSSTWEQIGLAAANMGPEMSFAARLRDAFPDETIAIIKVSRAATSISYWKEPGQLGHDTLMARIALIRDRLDASVLAGDIPAWSHGGFFWMQGENAADGALGPAQRYQADLDDLMAKIRIATASPTLPIIIGRLSILLDPANGGPVNQPHLDIVRAAQQAWAEADAETDWIDTDDLTLIDGYHFGSVAQLAFGHRAAAAWLARHNPRPLPTIRRRAGQPVRTHLAAVRYGISFPEPVSDLAPADFVISGDTGATVSALNPLPPFDGSVYELVVSAFQRPGVVDVALPPAAAQAVSSGLPSLPGFAENTAVLWAPHASVDELLVYAGFEPVNRVLQGLEDGSGWAGIGWEVNAAPPGYTSSSSAPLTYSTLASTPAHATGGDTYKTTARTFDLEKTFLPFKITRSSNSVDLPGSVFWLSYLIHPINASKPQRVGLMRGPGSSNLNDTVTIYQNGGFWTLDTVDASPVATTVPVTAGQTRLIVLRVALGGPSAPSSAHLWIDPSSLGGQAPDLSTAQASISVTSANFTFTRLHWYPGDGTNHGRLDEIRLGTTYASVTPVPPVAGYPVWSAAQDWNGTDSSFSADPDGDGVSNLLEYALGTIPTSGGSASLPSTSLTPSAPHSLRLTFPRARSELTYEVLASSDLAAWSVIATNPGSVGEEVAVTDIQTIGSNHPHRFLRLRVSVP